MEGTIFKVLPDEVIVQILLRVPMRSISAVSSTCIYWRSILLRREFWKFLAQLRWGEHSIPTDVTPVGTKTLPAIKDSNLVDWKAYVKIRSEVDEIATLVNLFQGFVPISLSADLDTKIGTITANFNRPCPAFEFADKAKSVLDLVKSCCRSTFEYRKGALTWLEQLPSACFLAIAADKPFLQFALKMTVEAIVTHCETEAQLIIEFWSGICDEELNYRENSDSEGRSMIIDDVIDQLVPALISAISDEKYAEEVEDNAWNVRKAAETCLQLVASVARDRIAPLVDTVLRRDLCAEDWKRQDVALTILAVILTDEQYDYVENNLPAFTMHVLLLMRSSNINVRSSAAFALSRICNRSYSSYIAAAQKGEIAQAILASLRDDERVRRFLYMCILNAESDELFDEYFTPLVQALLESLAVPNADRISIFEAVASLVNSQENIELIKPLLPFVLHTLQQSFDDGLILAMAITRKLKEEIATHGDQFMSLYLPRLQADPSEELLIAIAYLAQAPKVVFTKYLPSLMPLILPLLANVQQTQLFIGAVVTLVDICQGVKEAIAPFCPAIMNALFLALQAPNAEPQCKSDILGLIGDIAMAIGGMAFEVYLPQVLQMLSQAGHFISGAYVEDDELMASLLQSWIATWSSLFQSFHHNPALLIDALPQVLQVTVRTAQSADSSSATYAINLIGDILQCPGAIKEKVATIQEVQDCVACALLSSDPSTSQAAKWVSKLMDK